MIHERPGVWSAFGAQGTTELTDRRLAAVIAPADAAEGVQLVHSAAEAVSLYGGSLLAAGDRKLSPDYYAEACEVALLGVGGKGSLYLNSRLSLLPS